jgi:hypothetical protein
MALAIDGDPHLGCCGVDPIGRVVRPAHVGLKPLDHGQLP